MDTVRPADNSEFQNFGFMVKGLGFRVKGLGFRVKGLGFRVKGLGFRVEGFIGCIGPYRVRAWRLLAGTL